MECFNATKIFYSYLSNRYLQCSFSTKLKFQDVLEIVQIFCDDKENYEQMEQFLKKNLRLYQFVHATLFPKCFSRIDDYGIHSKLKFENIFRSWQNQKNLT